MANYICSQCHRQFSHDPWAMSTLQEAIIKTSLKTAITASIVGGIWTVLGTAWLLYVLRPPVPVADNENSRRSP